MRVRRYELMFIISPNHADADEVAAIIERLQQTIAHEGGEVTSVNHDPPWGRRRLAYPIRTYAGGEASRRSFNEGYYVLLHFTMEAAHVAAVERTLKFTDPILRYLLTIIETDARFTADEEAEAAASELSDAADDEGDEQPEAETENAAVAN